MFASDGVTLCDIVKHADGRFVCVNRQHGETAEVDRQDLIVYRLNLRTIATLLLEQLGGRIDFAQHEVSSPVYRLGRLRSRFAAARLYLCIRSCRASLLDAAMSIRGSTPVVLLVPMLFGTDTNVDLIEEQTGVTIFAADELFHHHDGRITANPVAMEELRHRLGCLDASQANTFRLSGDSRSIRYAKQEITLSETVGLWYLSQLLAQPFVQVNAVELEAARTGTTTRSSNSPTGEMLDEEARRAYQQRIAELDEDIAIAEKNNDVGVLDKLNAEKQQIIAGIRRATGLHGKSRVTTDESKSRKNIRQEMQRAIRRIAKSHPALAKHLNHAFKGNWLCYQPDEDPMWEF
ncbi:hypothetical protein Poly41_23000 [Novipirellula artificiosorum]|uniref:Uncharacterized protein n=2 Tax=Novipirellula artificiosorum TaxID=2528016 RepID=A0A5C6DWM0_9BACT|nr:hypothetical protein Poly41_23000 [Novipirellula artificiosorum]